MDDRHLHKKAFRVANRDLPRATKELAYSSGLNQPFSCRVVDVIVGRETSIVIVEKNGRNGYVENRWDFILE